MQSYFFFLAAGWRRVCFFFLFSLSCGNFLFLYDFTQACFFLAIFGLSPFPKVVSPIYNQIITDLTFYLVWLLISRMRDRSFFYLHVKNIQKYCFCHNAMPNCCFFSFSSSRGVQQLFPSYFSSFIWRGYLKWSYIMLYEQCIFIDLIVLGGWGALFIVGQWTLLILSYFVKYAEFKDIFNVFIMRYFRAQNDFTVESS